LLNRSVLFDVANIDTLGFTVFMFLDVAVFSLSLMGKNWHEYITEAKRCLVTNGILIIAETTKSPKGRLSNLRDEIQKQGFDIYSDEERADFTFIESRGL